MPFEIKQNDRRPHFVVVLKDNYGEEDEATVSLSTATGAVFNMRGPTPGTAVVISRGSCSINTATPPAAGAGEVTFAWGTALVNMAPGSYQAEVEVMWPSSEPETFPSGTNYWDVTVGDDIA